ncbi:MAG: arsenite methyltransferase [Archaeoglobaceae archaeon]
MKDHNIGDNEIRDTVRKEYSRIAKEDAGCCPSCGCGSYMDQAISIGYTAPELDSIPPESVQGLGCGNPTALADIETGERVLDLGSGAGIDVFLAAEKVGPTGEIIGLDMTEEMVEKSEKLAKSYDYSNVEFRLGEMEELPFEDNYFDLITSNCVINLSTDKSRTFKEIYRVLRPGGRVIISDIVLKGQLPESIKNDKKAWAGCIAGALQKGEYIKCIQDSGFKEVKVISEDIFGDSIPGVEIISLKIRAHK